MSAIGGSSLDVAGIIQQLMALERQPIKAIETRRATAQLQSDAVGRLRNAVEALRTAASSLLTSGIARYASKISNPAAASASVGANAAAGSVTFTVDQLASAHGLRTVNTVGSSTSAITTAATLALSTTIGKLGLGTVTSSAGVAPGTYTVKVTQSSAAAVRQGTQVLGASTNINPSNNTLQLQVNGVARTVNITNGSYTPAQLVAAVQAGLDATGGGVTASLDATGRMVLTTALEGSSASIRITANNNALGFNSDAVAVTGLDGKIQIDDDPPVNVPAANGASATVAVAAGGGTLTFQVPQKLRIGEATVGVVSTGDKSVAAVAAAINASKVGATAAAVKVAEGSWLLQLNSSATGSAHTLSIDSSLFAPAGGLIQTSAAGDAKITVGSGPGAYSITASGNVFTDVLPGVTITATATSATPVTLGVTRDSAAMADAVEGLIGKVNSLLADINMQTRYDPVKRTTSPLSGDGTIKRFADQVRAAVGGIVGGGNTQLASQVGITTNRDGTLKFDRAMFVKAAEADPAAVERLFARGGSGPSMTFGGAADATAAGSYAVEITTAATRASTGEILSGIPGPRTVGVRVGDTTVTYVVPNGATPADVAAGLNAAIAAAGVKINAVASGTGIALTASEFGEAGAFEVNTDLTGAGTWTAYTGTDVAGTIDGKAAIGVGNKLRLLTLDSSPAKGLEVLVAEGATGAVGNFDYTPGVAARLLTLTTSALSEYGAINTSRNNYETRINGFKQQIERFEARMVIKEEGMKRQWAAVQTLVAGFEMQSQWLAQRMNLSSSAK